MKLCKEDGCKSSVFGGGYCKYHQYRRHMRGGDLYRPKRDVAKPISKASKKRKKENKSYLLQLREFWDNAVKDGTNKCFFCGEKMGEREDTHHLRGRGAFLLEPEWWVHAHRQCHHWYHFAPIEFLIKKSWWGGFLERVRAKDIQTYYKIKNREIKSSESLEFTE